MKKKILGIAMALAMIMVLALPLGAGAAEDTDDTVITGEVPDVITVSDLVGFAMPSLVAGTIVNTETTPGAKSITVTSNEAGWTLTAVEAGGTPDGQMSGTPGILANKFKIKGGDAALYTSVQTAVTLETSGALGGATINNITFEQQVASDAAAGTYSITITFTASSGV
jgi:hypothetical protein